MLIDGPDVVLVYPEVETVDGDGNRVRRPGPTPVRVPGQWQPTVSAEDSSTGDLVVTEGVFRSRRWPGGAFARVERDGRDWDVVGEPQPRASVSRLISYTHARLRARKAKGVT